MLKDNDGGVVRDLPIKDLKGKKLGMLLSK